MSIITKIVSFFTSTIIAISGIFLGFKGDIPDPKSLDELKNTPDIFEHYEISDEIYVIQKGNIKNEEYNTVICLQGIVNKVLPQIYIVVNSSYEYYLNEMAAAGKTIIRNDESGKPWTTTSLITHFKSYINGSGYTLYRNSDLCEGLNIAFDYATLYGWLAVPEELKELAESCGLKMVKDLSKDKYNYKFMEKFFNEHKGEFSDIGIVHLGDWNPEFRDFAIQQNMFLCYSDSSENGNRFIKKILNNTAEYGYVLGWCAQEKEFVGLISKLGFSIIPADRYSNASILNSFDCEIPEVNKGESVKADPNKHYIAFVFSDGDNVQMMANGFSEYFRNLNLNNNYPVTWGFPCVCQELCSAASNRLYGCADKNTTFITGPSGIGYSLPSQFEEKSMDTYTTATAAAMLKSGANILTIIDDKPNIFKEASFKRKLGYYSRFENIDGGVIFLDPHMYESGSGKIWFSNDKPFLAVKNTLWSTEGYSGITDDWMKENAAEINAYKADVDSINGYSIICIHAWSLTPEKLRVLVGMLDDHIEIVSVPQLMEMVEKNIPHNDAKPE